MTRSLNQSVESRISGESLWDEAAVISLKESMCFEINRSHDNFRPCVIVTKLYLTKSAGCQLADSPSDSSGCRVAGESKKVGETAETECWVVCLSLLRWLQVVACLFGYSTCKFVSSKICKSSRTHSELQLNRQW